jgi:hypothetical protein
MKPADFDIPVSDFDKTCMEVKTAASRDMMIDWLKEMSLLGKDFEPDLSGFSESDYELLVNPYHCYIGAQYGREYSS